ncbi:bifunctional UDP-N-acetylglucosamine diphosphorylase/glucosamine-1-phosphate N-acetyltransferase GlmU [Geosporobacter ferrireducens]|uniref:bifunctional UDP-N-acetylglucosamine diphosphorylase/glucosamine-1-phosphate N-acetyltransferase GlmU n=1 Tax=Geosporobacter ferrireducens TaxID=1424294 RepID=UPI00139C96D6|nr:bifunctional UDP-N-acetylglucosamine diphosphorylase/glucosamine-1-phosphate N-acetyltransferase GlmU [Geosporobacter ferrireducens]MTI58280.1 bifunctional UDP-N-acetylglucosamine diphosphorylase/glucosamine-1-phosphate N-acetyltransferase GlmU [Geosporobacter ferrireducens]
MSKITAVILAAGAGTRMKSKIPKVLHQVCGKPMVEHVIDVAEEGISAEQTILVIGHEAELVKKATEHRSVSFALQTDQLGTGHAVMQTEHLLPEEGLVLLLYGDTPLIRGSVIQDLIAFHKEGGYQATVLTAILEDPTGYGRIVRGIDGKVERIVEQKDAAAAEKAIREINSGIYCYESKLLKEALKQLTNDNAQKEYYITDVVEILNRQGYRVGAFTIKDSTDIMGVNSRVQLAEAEEMMRMRILTQLMESGVTIIDPQNTYIDKTVQIQRDTIIYPGAIIKGNTRIGEDCIIGHNCYIENCVLKDRVEVQSSTLKDSFVEDDCHIGPYAYLRPNSRLGKHVKIGDFVEVKNSTLGDYSKASHLAYIGDGEVGKNVNIGCGVVFVNYDGKNKHRTIVEDNAFVGSNVNLVAPVTVEKNGYIATGSTITKTVPAGALSVARAKQENKQGWVERKGLLKKD